MRTFGSFWPFPSVPPQPLDLFWAVFVSWGLSPLSPCTCFVLILVLLLCPPLRSWGRFVLIPRPPPLSPSVLCAFLAHLLSFPPVPPQVLGPFCAHFGLSPPAFSNKLLFLNSLSPSLSRVCGVCVCSSPPPGGESLWGTVFPNPNFLWGVRPEAHTDLLIILF